MEKNQRPPPVSAPREEEGKKGKLGTMGKSEEKIKGIGEKLGIKNREILGENRDKNGNSGFKRGT